MNKIIISFIFALSFLLLKLFHKMTKKTLVQFLFHKRLTQLNMNCLT